MSIRSLVSHSVSLAVLLVSGSSLAHQPPALVGAQRATERAVACEGATPRGGDGYRNSFVRFGDANQVTRERVARVRSAAGYRDTVVRFGPTSGTLVACTPVTNPRTTASR
jgi:hypothetical protein